MKKSELRDLPLPTFFPKLKKLNRKIKFIYTADIVQPDILEVTFFDVKSKLVSFRVFSDGKTFITQKFDPDKWSEACVINLLPYFYEEKVVADSKASEEIGRDFFDNGKPNTLEALIAFQAKVREKDLNARYEKIRISTERFMAMIKDLPKDIDRWIHNVPLKSSRYIYYKRVGKIILGYCTNCSKDVVVKKAKHNEKGCCPECRSQIIFKAVGKSRKVCNSSSFAIMQRGEGHLQGAVIIRCFNVFRDFSEHYRKPTTNYYEEARYIINRKQFIMFKYESVYSTFYHKWLQADWHRKKTPQILGEYFLYTKNLNYVLKGTPWQYSAIKDFAQHKGLFNVLKYLQVYLEAPALEYLVKLKLYQITTECLFDTYYCWPESIYLRGKTLNEVLRVGKEDLPFIQKYDLSSFELGFYRQLKRRGYKLSAEVLFWVRWNIGNHSYAFEPILDLTEYTTPERIVRYISRQISICEYSYASHALHDWLDYLKNAKKLDYDIKSNTVIFPKNLKTAHDKAADLIKKKQEAIHNERIEAQELELNEIYGYDKGDYIVRAPKNVDEIIDEGAALNHCVGTYISRIAKGETSILFLREALNPDKPFYTIEVKDGFVRQVRGLNNCVTTPEVRKFMDKWEKIIKARITKKKQYENRVRVMVSA